MSQTIKFDSLRELVAAGGVKSTTILGQRGGFAVVANIGMQQRTLGTRAGEVRMFGRLDTAVKMLRDMGLAQFQVDVTHYEPGLLRAERPDTTKRHAAAAAALAHDRWFREQVTEAIAKDERGEATWHDHDAMWDELEAQAAQLVATKDKKAQAAAAKPARRSGTSGRRG